MKGNCIWSLLEQRGLKDWKRRQPTFSLDSFGSQWFSIALALGFIPLSVLLGRDESEVKVVPLSFPLSGW